MRVWKKWTALVLFAAPTLGAYAQVDTLSLETAIKLGLKRSENIQQAAIDMKVAEERIREAWGSFFPQISAKVQPTRYLKSPMIQFGDQSISVKQDWELVSTIQLTQAVYSFGRLTEALDLAKISTEMSATTKEAVERELRYAIESSYYSALSAQKVLRIAEDSLANAKKNQRALQTRFQGGRVPRFDNIKSSSDVAARVPVVSDARKSLELAYLQLNLLTEMESSRRPVLTTPMKEFFPPLSKNSILEKAYKAPQLKVNQLAVDMADTQSKLAKAEHYPTISAFASVDHSGTGDTLPPEDDRMFTTQAIGVVLNIPIYQGGSVSSRYRQALLERNRAQVEYKKQKENLATELESAMAEYNSNVEKYKSAKQAVSLAQRAYDLTRTRFETGGATRVDLNDSERALTNSRVQQQSALFEVYRNRALINKYTKKVNEL